MVFKIVILSCILKIMMKMILGKSAIKLASEKGFDEIVKELSNAKANQ